MHDHQRTCAVQLYPIYKCKQSHAECRSATKCAVSAVSYKCSLMSVTCEVTRGSDTVCCMMMYYFCVSLPMCYMLHISSRLEGDQSVCVIA